MPEFVFSACDAPLIGTTTIAGQVVPTMATGELGARVRRPGPDPARNGRHAPLLASGVITTRQFSMAKLTEIFGVEINAVWAERAGRPDAADSVAIQVSLDGGDTFLAWTGANWEVQSAVEVFNPVEVFCDHCATLPLTNPRHLGFRVRVSTVGNETPTLLGVTAFVEWAYDPMVDFDELLLGVLTLVRIPITVDSRATTAPRSRVALESNMQIDIDLPIKVFNLTTDPLMNENLFDSLDGLEVVLTGEQATGARFRIEAQRACPAMVSRQDEFLRKTAVPSVVALVGREQVAKGGNVGVLRDFKRGSVTRLVRERDHARIVRLPISIELTTDKPRMARMAIESIRDAISARELRSPASATRIILSEDAPGEQPTNLAEGIEVTRWSGHAFLPFPTRKFTEYTGVQEVTVELGSRESTWERRKL